MRMTGLNSFQGQVNGVGTSGNVQKKTPSFEGASRTSQVNSKQIQALKNQVMFGYSTYPKLSYEHTRTIEDPILGSIEVYKYSNGQELYALKDDSIPLVSFGILAKTGSANEKAHMNGVSHFLEHLVFKGTDKLGPEVADKLLENLGAGVNAHTGEDMTFFFLYDVPKESLAEAIRIQSELVQNPKVPQIELDRERGAVVEEIQMYAGNKELQTLLAMQAQVQADNPYRRTVLGPAEHIGDYMRSVVTGEAEKNSEVREQWQNRLELLEQQPSGKILKDHSGQPLSEREQSILKRLKQELSNRELTPSKLLDMYPFNESAPKLDDAGLRRELKVKDLSRKQILEYYNQHYGPDNRAILVVGDFDTQMVLDNFAEQLNKPFEPSKATPNRKKLKPVGRQAETVIQEENMDVVLTTLGFQGPKPNAEGVDKELAALNALSVLLGGGESSRLHQDLFEKKHWVNSVGMGFEENVGASTLYLSAQSQPEHLKSVQDAFKDHIRSVIEEGVTESELERVKTQLELYIAESMETQMNKLNALEYAVLNNRFERDLGRRLELIHRLTPADLQTVARKYMSGTGYAVSRVPRVAQDEEEKKTKASSSKKQKKVPRFSGMLSSRDESRLLSSGSELLVQNRPGDLFTSVTIQVNGGNQTDKIPGEADLLGLIIDRGTERRDARTLKQELAESGITLSTHTSLTGVEITLKGLSRKKEKMFEVVQDLLSNGPAIRPEEVEVVKDRLNQEHQARMGMNPDAVVDMALTEALFPNDHPAGTLPSRIVKNMGKITPETLKETHQRLFKPSNMTLSMVGDVTIEEGFKQAEQWMASLDTTLVAIPPKVATPKLTENRLITQSYKGLDQSRIMRGWHAPGLKDVDRAAMTVLTNLLSGGASARFFQTFRVKPEKALAYTARARYASSDGTMKFFIGTDHENVKTVMPLFQKEVDRLINEPTSEDELNKVKLLIKSRTISLSQRVDNESSYLASHRRLGSDSKEDQLPKIEAVTPADIQRVAQKYLGQPSIAMVLAPEEVLNHYALPVDGESTFDFDASGKLVTG